MSPLLPQTWEGRAFTLRPRPRSSMGLPCKNTPGPHVAAVPVGGGRRGGGQTPALWRLWGWCASERYVMAFPILSVLYQLLATRCGRVARGRGTLASCMTVTVLVVTFSFFIQDAPIFEKIGCTGRCWLCRFVEGLTIVILADGAVPLAPLRVVHAVVPRVLLSYLVGNEAQNTRRP